MHLLQQPDGRILATKVAREPRVGAVAQVENRRVVSKELGDRIPAVVFADEDDRDVLVTECPAVHNLQELVDRHGPTTEYYVVWVEVVDRLLDLWLGTAIPRFEPHRASRNHFRRYERGSEGVQNALYQLFGATSPLARIVVNGVDYGSWSAVEAELISMGRPAFHVTCHGDPHAGNVLVDSWGRWYLIDWEWTGTHHDWRMMVSHLLGSWYVNDLLATGGGSVSIHPAGLALSYRTVSTTQLEWFEAPAIRAFHLLTTVDRSEQDISDLARHTALLLLREVPKVVVSGNYEQAAPLLGEAIRLLMDNPRWQPHAILRGIVQANATTVFA